MSQEIFEFLSWLGRDWIHQFQSLTSLLKKLFWHTSVLPSSALKLCKLFLVNWAGYNDLVLMVFDGPWSDRPFVPDSSDVVLCQYSSDVVLCQYGSDAKQDH